VNLLSLTRWKASAIHLALSALIATAVVVLMLTLWYPRPYFYAMGGATLLLILVGVDVVIGPLITLIIFNPKKKSLQFDLCVIAVLQLAALAYGSYVMFTSRPVFNVFVVDRFDLVAANQLSETSLDKAPPEYRSLPLTGPKLVAVRQPDGQKRFDITMSSLNGGHDISELPEYYVPYPEFSEAAGKRARPLPELEKKWPDKVGMIRDFVRDSGRKAEDLGTLAMKARNEDMTLIVDVKTGAIIGALPIDPW
jgi:hypothetical protein